MPYFRSLALADIMNEPVAEVLVTSASLFGGDLVSIG